MNLLTYEAASELIPTETLERLAQTVSRRLGGQVRGLCLQVGDGGIRLQGWASSYHAKQLAQHAVMKESGWAIEANEIVVLRARRNQNDEPSS